MDTRAVALLHVRRASAEPTPQRRIADEPGQSSTHSQAWSMKPIFAVTDDISVDADRDTTGNPSAMY